MEMSILFYFFLFLILLLAILFFGKPHSIWLEAKGYIDTYEETDYKKNNRRIKTPYKEWKDPISSFTLVGNVTYLFNKFPFNWGRFSGLPVTIELKNSYYNKEKNVEIKQICPKGFDIYLKDTTGSIYYADSEPLIVNNKSLSNNPFKLYIVFKQKDKSIKIKEPLLFRFIVIASYNTRRIFPAKRIKLLDYEFHIGPELGDVWVGIDPGTTGTCIASATNLQNIIIQKDNNGQDLITPSVIAFDKKLDFNKTDDIKNYYRYGFSANVVSGLPTFDSFQSIKKMLGYDYRPKVKFNNGKIKELNGKVLTYYLVDGIINDHKKFLTENKSKHNQLFNNGKYDPLRAVITIPNNFTATKIQALMESLRMLNQFKEIRYIYESEAILLYYLNRLSKEEQINKTVLVFDMGGTTINVSILNIKAEENEKGDISYEINVHAKLGYAIGGDNLDYCLLKYLYEFDKIKSSFLGRKNPFQAGSKKEDIAELKKNVLDIKKKIVENHQDINIPAILSSTDINNIFSVTEDIDEHLKLKITPSDDIAENLKKINDGKHPLFKYDKNLKKITVKYSKIEEVIYKNIEQITKDIITIGKHDNINTVLFAGRSTLFPWIKETVISKLQLLNIEADFYQFPEDELKSAVAKGACIYGVAKDAIKLNNLMVNGTLGFKKTKGLNIIGFNALIEMGTHFFNKHREIEKRIDWPNDYFDKDQHFVEFYQVMGMAKDAQDIISKNQKHKRSLLTKIKLEFPSKEIGIKVFENDDVICVVEDEEGKRSPDKVSIYDHDIIDDNDEHYTWIIK